MGDLTMDLKNREDRIGKYLTPFLNDYIFDELSDNYLQKSGLADILRRASTNKEK